MYAWLPTIKKTIKLLSTFFLIWKWYKCRNVKYAFLILQSRSNVSHMFDYPQNKHQEEGVEQSWGNLRQIKNAFTSSSFWPSQTQNLLLLFCHSSSKSFGSRGIIISQMSNYQKLKLLKITRDFRKSLTTLWFIHPFLRRSQDTVPINELLCMKNTGAIATKAP